MVRVETMFTLRLAYCETDKTSSDHKPPQTTKNDHTAPAEDHKQPQTTNK